VGGKSSISNMFSLACTKQDASQISWTKRRRVRAQAAPHVRRSGRWPERFSVLDTTNEYSRSVAPALGSVVDAAVLQRIHHLLAEDPHPWHGEAWVSKPRAELAGEVGIKETQLRVAVDHLRRARLAKAIKKPSSRSTRHAG
jgi:hypothetical protein